MRLEKNLNKENPKIYGLAVSYGTGMLSFCITPDVTIASIFPTRPGIFPFTGVAFRRPKDPVDLFMGCRKALKHAIEYSKSSSPNLCLLPVEDYSLMRKALREECLRLGVM